MSEQQYKRERIAYEELQPGDIIQEGDEHRNADGRWHAYDASLCGSRVHGAWDGRARRPYKISAILEIGDALADAQKAATQLQDERNEFQTALIESRLAQKRKVAEVMDICKERDELQRQVDELRAERSDEPTARQVRDMLRTWAIELDWSAGCFDSVSREQIDTIQKTLIAVIERIEWLCSENSDDN